MFKLIALFVLFAVAAAKPGFLASAPLATSYAAPLSYAATPAIAAPISSYGHAAYGLGHAYASPLATSYAAAPALAHSYAAPVATYGFGHASYGGLGHAYGYGAHSYAAPLAHGW